MKTEQEIKELERFKRNFEGNIQISVHREKELQDLLSKAKEENRILSNEIKTWKEAYNDVAKERDKLRERVVDKSNKSIS